MPDWFRAWAAVLVSSADAQAPRVLLRGVRRRLADASDATARLETVQLAEGSWLQACWRVSDSSDEHAGLRALHMLRAATETACRELPVGRQLDLVEIEPAFSITVEPADDRS